MYIALAILAFGLIIAVHELGHFIAAKALGVKVIEFAIGMGPKLIKIQGKETLYSLRLLPFGGFCNMEGETGVNELSPQQDYKESNRKFIEKNDDNASDETQDSADGEDGELDPRSFLAQKRWRRIVILIAGSAANLIMAFIIVLILTIGAQGYIGTVITHVIDSFPNEGVSELQAGDRLIALNGERLYYYDDFGTFMNLNAGNPVTFTIDRNGEIIEYHRRVYEIDGENVYRYNIRFNEIEAGFWENFKYSTYKTLNYVRMIRISLAMMFSGAASLSDVAGPVGIVSAMNTVGQQSPTVGAAIGNIINLMAFIGVNVAVINMLPIPAMDGGRVLFIFITWVIEKLTKKQLNPKYENYINTGAFVLLIGLMVLVMYNDVMRLIS